MALGALIIKGRLQVTDEEIVEQIKKSAYLSFILHQVWRHRDLRAKSLELLQD